VIHCPCPCMGGAAEHKNFYRLDRYTSIVLIAANIVQSKFDAFDNSTIE
jgi:hypothetical protein